MNELMTSMTSTFGTLTASLTTVLGALLILVIGLIIAKIVAGIVRKVLVVSKADELVLNFDFFKKAQQSGWKVRPSVIASTIVKWLLILFTFSAVAEKLDLNTISVFMTQIIAYIPQLIVAAILLTLGFIIGQFVHDLLAQSMRTANAADALQKYFPAVVKFAIITFAVMAAATQVGVAATLIETFFATFLQALALSLALGIGLSFGLGGKDHASRIIERFLNK